ncbi:hypothetical protein J6590_016520 [Homalodisca vitripennis]|nr:hypothetical protein J6590_016520 [Homalodisca vitripennis]
MSRRWPYSGERLSTCPFTLSLEISEILVKVTADCYEDIKIKKLELNLHAIKKWNYSKSHTIGLEEELRFSTGPCRRGFKTRTDQRAGRNASPDTSLTDQLIAGPTEQKKCPRTASS